MTKEIDQRAQRHDPASKQTRDSNDRPDSQTKQPGGADPSHDGVDEPVGETGKFNKRDDGHGEVTTDDPLDHIAHDPDGRK